MTHAHAPVVVYSTPFCSYCTAAKRLLERKGVAYTEVDVMLEPEQREAMLRRSHRQTVPQIFIGERHVGGYHELHALEKRGELDVLLTTTDEPVHSP